MIAPVPPVICTGADDSSAASAPVFSIVPPIMVKEPLPVTVIRPAPGSPARLAFQVRVFAAILNVTPPAGAVAVPETETLPVMLKVGGDVAYDQLANDDSAVLNTILLRSMDVSLCAAETVCGSNVFSAMVMQAVKTISKSLRN